MTCTCKTNSMISKIIFAISAFMIMALAVLNMKVSFNDMEGPGVGLDALQKVYAQTPEDGGGSGSGTYTLVFPEPAPKDKYDVEENEYDCSGWDCDLTWSIPRSEGELLTLGFDVNCRWVSKTCSARLCIPGGYEDC
jgi:hypothetical protein